MSLQMIGFASPLMLWGLALLPLLWWLLRALPPAPQRRIFPGIVLLEGLRARRAEAERTPWPILLLRTIAVAALILGLAGPVLNPDPDPAPERGPLLVLLDGTPFDASDWAARQDLAAQELRRAAAAGRPAALVRLTDLPVAGALSFQSADRALSRLPGLAPAAHDWGGEVLALVADLPQSLSTLWISDGLERPSRRELAEALAARGPLQVREIGPGPIGLSAPHFEAGVITMELRRARTEAALRATVLAIGPDPAGNRRELARVAVELAPGSAVAPVVFHLPAEVRNRLTRFEIEGRRSAAAVALADDSLRRRKVALVSGREEREGLVLLSGLHYLRAAFAPHSDLTEGDLTDLLRTAPDVVVLADLVGLTPDEEAGLSAFVEKGGLLLRFAGPNLAAAAGRADDPLLPVALREGGRTVGGTMSWGAPRALAPFEAQSPFYGLAIPGDVSVRAQVLARPDPGLAVATLAMLQDGTPLVTRAARGAGQVVLFHVTAGPDWSDLPLSGLFVEMLERLSITARHPDAAEGAELAAREQRSFTALRALDGFGHEGPGDAFAAVPGAELLAARAQGASRADMPPGLWQTRGGQLALNVTGAGRLLAPARWPAGINPEGQAAAGQERPLKGWLLALAVLALVLDVPLTRVALRGGLRRGAAAAMGVAAAIWLLPGPPVSGAQAGEALSAEAERRAIAATSEVVLGYIRTGDAEVDRRSEAGLRGLGQILKNRTAIEPGPPMAVDPEHDELAFFSFLYWPVLADAPMPAPPAYRRLNQFLQTGGMILFDTRDGDVATSGAPTPEARALQRIARPLQIPPLEPIAPDHVLTRTFYLLQDYPGRHVGAPVWVEAPPADAVAVEGMPFRNLNDGVTPVVIGGNDWASAWAMDAQGAPLYPVGRGFAGERQREMAWRFGVNLIMHVLTGNYKSDQVHVPALLERLGQ